MYPVAERQRRRGGDPVVHLNPLSGRWEPDLSRNQRHVNAAIFYNVWRYYQVTDDLDFLRDHGAEMMLEIARFWSSIAHFNPDRDRWEIHGVMGPTSSTRSTRARPRAAAQQRLHQRHGGWICETAQRCSTCSPRAARARCGRRSA